jgi:hypothetical protein
MGLRRRIFYRGIVLLGRSRLAAVSFRNARADRGEIDRAAPAFGVDYRGDRRRGVPAGPQLP